MIARNLFTPYQDLALGRAESRYSYEHHMRSANGASTSNEVSEMAGRDHVSAETRDGISMESSVKKSVMERRNENSKIGDGGIEKDNISQEEEGEQSFETHSDTGVCNKTVVIMTGIHCIQ